MIILKIVHDVYVHFLLLYFFVFMIALLMYTCTDFVIVIKTRYLYITMCVLIKNTYTLYVKFYCFGFNTL